MGLILGGYLIYIIGKALCGKKRGNPRKGRLNNAVLEELRVKR